MVLVETSERKREPFRLSATEEHLFSKETNVPVVQIRKNFVLFLSWGQLEAEKGGASALHQERHDHGRIGINWGKGGGGGGKEKLSLLSNGN